MYNLQEVLTRKCFMDAILVIICVMPLKFQCFSRFPVKFQQKSSPRFCAYFMRGISDRVVGLLSQMRVGWEQATVAAVVAGAAAWALSPRLRSHLRAGVPARKACYASPHGRNRGFDLLR